MLTIGFCTTMKTAEVTRQKQAAAGVTPPSTWALFTAIYREEGIKGIYKGVNAVAVRQCTNWGSRYAMYILTMGIFFKISFFITGWALPVYPKTLYAQFSVNNTAHP